MANVQQGMETPSTVLCCSLKLLFIDNPRLYSLLNENLFTVPNKSAFEKLMYPLLQMINKEKCTNIPPVNRSTEAKFRSEVLRIIKEISVEYPALQIPRVTPTLFLSPGGEKFIDLMNKLSSLALEIKVENMMNGNPGMTMLSRPSNLKTDEVRTCIKVLESLILYHKQRFEDCRNQEEKMLTNFKNNLSQVRDVQSKLHNKTEETITNIKKVVDQLSCEPEKKRMLMELDGKAITEWNEELEKYETELHEKEQKLESYNKQLRELYKAVQSLDSSCVTPVVLDAAEILPSSTDSEVDSRIQPLYEDGKLVMSRFLTLADESLKSVATELSEAHIVDISSLIPQLKEMAEIQLQTWQMAAYNKERLHKLQSQILGIEEKVVNGGNASLETFGDLSQGAKKGSLASPTMNDFHREVVDKMGSSGLELPFKSTPPFGLMSRDAIQVSYTADQLAMTPLTSQLNSFDLNVRSNIDTDTESVTNLLVPSTIKKKPRKTFFPNIPSTSKTMPENRHSSTRKGLEIRRNLLSNLAKLSSKNLEGTPFREYRSVQSESSVTIPLLEMSSSLEMKSPSPVRAPSPMTLDKVVERMVSNIPSSVKKGHLADNDPESSFTNHSDISDGELSLTSALRKLSLETPVPSRNVEEHFEVLSLSTSFRSILKENPPCFLSSDSEGEST